jgi:hypothetical protein
VQLIRETLRIPFEFSACRTYARSYGVPCHLVDLNWISREHLPLYESEVLTLENLTAIADTEDRSLHEVIEAARRRAARCIGGEMSLVEAGVRADWESERGRRRETFLACRIRKIAAFHPRVVHVGGWIHLVEDREGKSLASLLRDLSPTKVLLGDSSPRPD